MTQRESLIVDRIGLLLIRLGQWVTKRGPAALEAWEAVVNGSLFAVVGTAEVVAPDDDSITRFAPFVQIPPEARDALLNAVEALAALLDPEMISGSYGWTQARLRGRQALEDLGV